MGTRTLRKGLRPSMSADPKAAFEGELELFERNRMEWVRAHQGQYVVICGSEVAGFYSGFEPALRAGLERFGIDRLLLVKQVWAEEPVEFIF